MAIHVVPTQTKCKDFLRFKVMKEKNDNYCLQCSCAIYILFGFTYRIILNNKTATVPMARPTPPIVSPRPVRIFL